VLTERSRVWLASLVKLTRHPLTKFDAETRYLKAQERNVTKPTVDVLGRTATISENPQRFCLLDCGNLSQFGQDRFRHDIVHVNHGNRFTRNARFFTVGPAPQ